MNSNKAADLIYFTTKSLTIPSSVLDRLTIFIVFLLPLSNRTLLSSQQPMLFYSWVAVDSTRSASIPPPTS